MGKEPYCVFLNPSCTIWGWEFPPYLYLVVLSHKLGVV